MSWPILSPLHLSRWEEVEACPSPPGPEWFREETCRPSCGLTPPQWSSLRTCFHSWPENGLTHLMKISWVLMRPAGSEAGSRQVGSQAVRGMQDNRTGNTVRSNLPRKINISNFATCSGQTWLSSTLPLSISSTVHSSFPKVFTSFNFSLVTTSAWPLSVPLCRESQQIKTLSLLMTKSKDFGGISAPTLVHLVFKNITSLHSLRLCSPL